MGRSPADEVPPVAALQHAVAEALDHAVRAQARWQEMEGLVPALLDGRRLEGWVAVAVRKTRAASEQAIAALASVFRCALRLDDAPGSRRSVELDALHRIFVTLGVPDPRSASSSTLASAEAKRWSNVVDRLRDLALALASPPTRL